MILNKRYGLLNQAISFFMFSGRGILPFSENIKKDKANWLWFMTWNDGNQSGTNESNFWEGSYYNEDSIKTAVYSHENIITLDELPDLTSYPLK